MAQDPLVGRVLGGRYRLDELIGRGGFGAVYGAQQLLLDRRVAVKINIHMHRPSLAARFKREARVMARLSHPGCVTLLDYGEEEDGLIYMVQEFVHGKSVREVLDAEGYLAPARAVRVVDGLLSALAAAHRVGIVHRDIKPSNIMLSEVHGEEAVRVLDFGIAKIFDSELDVTRLTESGRVIGTPAYMAPEQIRSLEVGPRTDIYATGVLLFHLLTGRKPFAGSSVFDIYRHHLETPPPTAAGQLSPELAALIDCAMAKEPTDRFETAPAMREALRGLTGNLADGALSANTADTVESGPPTTLPTSSMRQGPIWVRRAAAVAGAVIVTAAVWFVIERLDSDANVLSVTPLAEHQLDSGLDAMLAPPVKDAADVLDAAVIDTAIATDSAPIMDAVHDAGPDTIDTRADAGNMPPDASTRSKRPARPASWRLTLRKGKRSEAQGDLEAAEQHFKEAVRRAPRRAEPLVELGRLYHQRGDLRAARQTLDKARSLEPEREDALYYYGLVHKQATGDDSFLYFYRQRFPEGRFKDAVKKHIGAAPPPIVRPVETQ